jgi:hypothetical protein
LHVGGISLLPRQQCTAERDDKFRSECVAARLSGDEHDGRGFHALKWQVTT